MREAQIALLPSITADLWQEERPTGWGPVTLRWIVAKTYQHTAEHISDVLRLALFWDYVAAHNQSEQESEISA